MQVTKKVQGSKILLELDKIKDYSRFTLYQVSKYINGIKTALYKETYTDLDIKEIEKNGNVINDDKVRY